MRMEKPFAGKTLVVTAPSRQWVTPEGKIDWALRRRALAAAEDLGFAVREMAGSFEETARFAGDDDTRARDLMCAMTEVDGDLVMSLRGGYGAGRLLTLLDWHRLSSGRTPLVGYSDTTAITTALLAKTGRESWQGPTLRDLIDIDPLTEKGLKQVLGLEEFSVSWESDAEPLTVEGALWGGNLAVLTSLLGSDFFPDVSGGILFIEDVGEAAYRVERMLLTLANAGILARQKALIVGDLAGVDRATGWQGDFDSQMMLDFIRRRTGIPVITGLPFGHLHAKCSLPVGRFVRLEAGDGRVRLTDAPLP